MCFTRGHRIFNEINKVISGGLIEIAVHSHNDFWLATENSIAAVKGGVTIINTVINGLGDIAGNALFEEVVCVLEVFYMM